MFVLIFASSVVLGFVSMSVVLCIGCMGCGVFFVMCVVGGVPLWVVCVCVLWCRCCVFVSVMHLLAILSALFCVICSVLMFVADTSGDHMVETYSSMGIVMALYVTRIVSFCSPPPMLFM